MKEWPWQLLPMLLIVNVHDPCIYRSYWLTFIKYLPLWLIVSAECWPFSVSFLWSGWQICMQVTEKINNFIKSCKETWNPRVKSPRNRTTLESQRLKVEWDSLIMLSVQISLFLVGLQSPTLQGPDHRTGWARVTSVCQMNPEPCNESVQQYNPLQEAFWGHT